MSKTRIESFAKYAGIATVTVEWLALLLYYLQMPAYFGGQYPISYYASLPQTKLIFTICYTLAGIFFWIFIRHHLHKYYRAPVHLFTISMFLFLALAIVPFNPHDVVSHTIHSIFGYSSSLFFAVGMFLMARNAKNKLVSRVTIVALAISIVLLFAFAQSPKDSHLIFAFEAGSWLVWQLWIIWITFYSYQKKL
jgi:hypothetical protein